jgi:molecular chaperone GrpE
MNDGARKTMSQTPFDDNQEQDDQENATDAMDLGATEGDTVDAQQHQKLKDERDKLMYAVAESQNMRKRLEAEKEQAVQYANQSLIKSLIPIIDNFERALAVDPNKADAASVLKGLQLVHDQLMKELEKQNVEVIDPRPGTPFDPTRHEALMEKPDTKLKPGTVAQALTRGYALRGRTIRPASVMIAK